MRTLFVCALCAVVFVIGCKEDPAVPATLDYYPLTTGSYWIYDWYQVQPDGTESSFNNSDTIRIAGDTLINGNQYAIQEYQSFSPLGQRFLRDSIGFLVNERGHILLAPPDYADTLHFNSESQLPTYSFMEGDGHAVSVPAGDFETVLVRSYISLEELNHPEQPRRPVSQYADGVGDVFHTAFYASWSSILEARLVEYHIAE